MLVACPGFTADCLETLEEIALRLCAAVRERGGEEPRVVPCLNDHPAWISGLARIVREETAQPIRSSGSGHPPSAALRTQHGESR